MFGLPNSPLVAVKDWPEMLEKLRRVFEAFRNTKLTLRLNKCYFGKREVEYLGFVIGNGGLRPGKAKTSAIDNYSEPENMYDVRRFLRLTGFFRRFVKNYAVPACALNDLLRKGQTFK